MFLSPPFNELDDPTHGAASQRNQRGKKRGHDDDRFMRPGRHPEQRKTYSAAYEPWQERAARGLARRRGHDVHPVNR
jgi:hypothetical protein